MRQDTLLCRGCGLVLSNPRLSDEEYKKFYESDLYRDIYETKDYQVEYRKKYNLLTGSEIFDSITKIKDIRKIKALLEFGCGGGWNLIPFKDKGIDTKGYDYSNNLVSLGKEFGLNLFQGAVSDVRGKFDVIILNHVVEHFADLKENIEGLKEHLNQGGIFYIAAPDIKNFSIGQLQAAHTFYFNLKTLKYYMSKCGLKMIDCGVSQKIHLYAVFKIEEENLDVKFLNGNYNNMRKIITKYYLEECFDRIFPSGNFKGFARSLARSKFGTKVQSAVFK